MAGALGAVLLKCRRYVAKLSTGERRKTFVLRQLDALPALDADAAGVGNMQTGGTDLGKNPREQGLYNRGLGAP